MQGVPGASPLLWLPPPLPASSPLGTLSCLPLWRPDGQPKPASQPSPCNGLGRRSFPCPFPGQDCVGHWLWVEALQGKWLATMEEGCLAHQSTGPTGPPGHHSGILKSAGRRRQAGGWGAAEPGQFAFGPEAAPHKLVFLCSAEGLLQFPCSPAEGSVPEALPRLQAGHKKSPYTKSGLQPIRVCSGGRGSPGSCSSPTAAPF